MQQPTDYYELELIEWNPYALNVSARVYRLYEIGFGISPRGIMRTKFVEMKTEMSWMLQKWPNGTK